MAFKLKLNADGTAVVQDGKPVFVDEEKGTELPLDANEVFNKYHTLGEENKQWRLKHKEAEAALKQFEGLDIETVQANLDAVEKLKQVDMAKKGELEALKAEFQMLADKRLTETTQGYENKLKAISEKAQALESRLTKNTIRNHFLNSAFIKENVAVPPDMIEAAFGNRFKVTEDDKVIALGEDGSPMLSEKKLTEVADFEEALELMIKKYPHKDAILKNKQNPGGGMNSGGRGIANTPEAQKLADKNTSPAERLNAARKLAAMRGN